MNGFILNNVFCVEKTNKSSYDKSRFMYLICHICGTTFHRPPSHVARNKYYTVCSRGCAGEAAKVRVESNCVICGKIMMLTPSNIPRITTCSKECSTLRRIKNIKTVKNYSLGAYQNATKKIVELNICKKCKIKIGPWVIRNLKAEIKKTGEVIIDDSTAELWCKRCHLNEIAPKGPPARMKNKKINNCEG